MSMRSAVFADMFHPLTLINLLTELFRRRKQKTEEEKKEHGWKV